MAPPANAISAAGERDASHGATTLSHAGTAAFRWIIMTPEHTMAAYIAKEDRKGPPTNDAEAAALLSSMNAYTGRYRIERDKFITTVDGAWNEIFKAREQVRYFALDGD